MTRAPARLRKQGIVLIGVGADEAPEGYKRPPDVLASHGETIRVKRTLPPLCVAVAGRDVFTDAVGSGRRLPGGMRAERRLPAGEVDHGRQQTVSGLKFGST